MVWKLHILVFAHRRHAALHHHIPIVFLQRLIAHMGWVTYLAFDAQRLRAYRQSVYRQGLHDLISLHRNGSRLSIGCMNGGQSFVFHLFAFLLVGIARAAPHRFVLLQSWHRGMIGKPHLANSVLLPQFGKDDWVSLAGAAVPQLIHLDAGVFLDIGRILLQDLVDSNCRFEAPLGLVVIPLAFNATQFVPELFDIFLGLFQVLAHLRVDLGFLVQNLLLEGPFFLELFAESLDSFLLIDDHLVDVLDCLECLFESFELCVLFFVLDQQFLHVDVLSE